MMDINLLNERIARLKEWEQTESLNEILYSVFSSLSSYTQGRFDALTKEISEETVLYRQTHVIRTAVCAKEDIKKQVFLAPVSSEPPINSPGYITTVFADCDYPAIQELMDHTYPAEIRAKTGTIGTQVSLRYSLKYLHKLKSLYYIFNENELPWTTVNSIYFYKFLDVYGKDIGQDVEVDGFDIDFGQYDKYLSYDKVLLWNISPMTANVSFCKAVPAYDTILYEHTLNNLQFDVNHYLICSVGDRFTSFRRGQVMYVRTYSRKFEKFDLLRITDAVDTGGPLYLQPKSNRKKVGFIESAAKGRYIPTRGEAERIVYSLNNEADLSLVDIEVIPFSDENVKRYKGIDYNYFVEANSFLPDKKLLLFTFKAGAGLKWAHEVMFYVLSELQLYFYEYNCVGKMV